MREQVEIDQKTHTALAPLLSTSKGYSVISHSINSVLPLSAAAWSRLKPHCDKKDNKKYA